MVDLRSDRTALPSSAADPAKSATARTMQFVRLAGKLANIRQEIRGSTRWGGESPTLKFPNVAQLEQGRGQRRHGDDRSS
jgi:hypothetical protein